ncbi:uncharacterized protein BYT42DRAFT_551293 [Radiomyces spectabilis]|uniref:uncharacterized protein n=1 Tax=Radiomyces spectabilis TaxID=64574 RepID=UPI00221F3C74|nr:uncharacterized protein BYT42DRAFT_551293 [Radiomyces spectabilis]KAI8393508.1 hypothetical protein BYT42DRAFT_551293 [Radiomyces spectabilis]
MSCANEKAWHFQFNKLWSSKLEDSINCVVVGKPFLDDLSEENDLLIGTTAGRVLILNQTKPVECLLETKGASIQALQLYDLTGYGATDLVVGDSGGVITLFSRQQILSKRDLGASVTQIQIHKDLVSGYEIVAGDNSGTVTSFQQYDALWKLNVAEESAKLATLGMKGRRSPFIRCILSATLTDCFGMEMSCLLVCDGYPFIHFIQDGERIQSLRVPTVVRSICAGHFLNTETMKNFVTTPTKTQKTGNGATKLDSCQVLLAGQDGYVYIMVNYEIYRWFKVGFCLNKVVGFRPRCLGDHDTDLVVCVGHSNTVHVYKDGQPVATIETSDWPHVVTFGDVNADGQDELILGLLNQTIEVYQWNAVRSLAMDEGPS